MPTHALEGPDYLTPGSGALSGERIYKDTDPATEMIAVDANAVYHGLRKLVKDEQISGDLTATDGATDQTEGFVRLAKAIRRAANRKILATLTMTSDGQTFDVPADTFAFNIVESGGPFPGGALYPDTATPARNNRRVVLFVNGSASAKCIGDSAFQAMATLAPGEACLFVGMDNGSGATIWRPIGKGFDRAAFGLPFVTAKLFSTDHPTEVGTATFTAYYLRHSDNRLVTINTGFGVITVTSSTASIYIADSSNTPFPDAMKLHPNVDASITPLQTPQFPLVGSLNGTETTFKAVIDGGAIVISKYGGGNFAGSDEIHIYGFTWTYFAKP